MIPYFPFFTTFSLFRDLNHPRTYNKYIDGNCERIAEGSEMSIPRVLMVQLVLVTLVFVVQRLIIIHKPFKKVLLISLLMV
jgi:hypothetical protein